MEEWKNQPTTSKFVFQKRKKKNQSTVSERKTRDSMPTITCNGLCDWLVCLTDWQSDWLVFFFDTKRAETEIYIKAD